MRLVGGKEWNFESLTVPQMGLLSATEITNPISLEDFLAAACRRCDHVKTTTLLFDIHMRVPEFGGFARIGEQIQQGHLEHVPYPLQLHEPLPPNAKMGIIINNLEDGAMNIIKMFHFPEKVGINHARKLCTGTLYVPVFRPGPWALRKAIQHMIQRIPGYRVLWNNVSEKVSVHRASSAQWAPEDDALRAGIDFINQHAPEGDALNEQTFWILSNVREGSGSPIAGWPESKVRNMCINKSRGLAGAQPQTHFPLHTYSLKNFMSTKLLPLIYPLLVMHGIMMIGWPGVGKTPALIIMILAVGRYHVAKHGLSGSPSWRRAKSLDNFRHRIPCISDGVFLDDPSREKLDLADLKSFVTAEEDQTCAGRYNDIKLVRGQVRAYAGNHLSKEEEPAPDTRTTISSQEVLQLLGHTFPGEKDADKMAVLKRSVVFIFGKNALYLRLPSEHEDDLVHRIDVEDLHLDLLAPHDKYLYAEYKTGSLRKGDDFQKWISREQSMIMDSFGEMETKGPKAYVKQCNSRIQELLRPQPQDEVRVAWLPSSSSSADEGVPPTIPFSVRLADPSLPRKRLTNASRFEYNTPERRLRSKQSIHIPIPSDVDQVNALSGDQANASSSAPRTSNDHAEAESVVAEELPATSDVFGDSVGEPMDAEESPEEEAARHLHS